ncbi:translation initiation factor eIF epsilon subunit, putative [Babesia caballi]|uniref:Translation initiation factor eIF epsilon subunit, putative n=1 Tax=Babesia caballi TaxID=5871 RepID=A0AAV4M112_BABCB|nr:translation initiation factor eIF epsilon subunit, putative [Babesia caballi]
MEAFMLVEDDGLAFEPLASMLPVNELYIGTNSIFQETLENLWESGITHVRLVVEKNKAKWFERYQRRYTFGRRQGHLDMSVVPLNVNKVSPGTVLRELLTIIDGLNDFILLFWNTLLTVPLYDSLELHRARKNEFQRYAMSIVYLEDDIQRRFSKPDDDCIILLNKNNEVIAYRQGVSRLRLDKEWMQHLNGGASQSVRYDLCKTSIYICNKQVAEHFANWFEHVEMDDYINDCLTREFKTDEIYVTILKRDVMFPNYPPALRITTPKDYYAVYMAYITRFHRRETFVHKAPVVYNPHCGPMVHEQAIFRNNSAFLPPLSENEDLFTAVSSSIVGQNVRIGSRSIVYRCIIFDDVTIGSDCVMQESIIMNGATIEDGAVIPAGSIICPNVRVTAHMVQGIGCSLRASHLISRYVDLTTERDRTQQRARACGNVHVWPINAFGNIEGTYIGTSFYDVVSFKAPPLSSTVSGGDEKGSRRRAPNAGDGRDASCSSDDDSGYEYFDYEARDPQSMMDPEVSEELRTLVVECLEDPRQLPNKVLEIKSLKISHNLQKAEMVKVAFRHALRWIIEQPQDPDELHGIMEKARLKDLVESFEHQMIELNHYSDVLKVCSDLRKDVDFFSYVCEALYHADIMEFEMLNDWLARNGISGPRINSFANWLSEE